MDFDPIRVEAAIAAMPGSVLYGLYHLVALLRSGQPVTVRDVVSVVVNIVCAAIAGVIMAYAFAGGLIGMVPWASLRDPFPVGLAFGAFSWELLPLAFTTVPRLAQQWADKLNGGSK